MSANVFAADMENIPIEVTQFANETQQEITCIDEGIYTVGDSIFIDVSVRREFIGSNTENSDENFMMDAPTGVPMPKGANPPPLSSIWSWSSGKYSGKFEMSERVFTNYRFTGFSTYNVEVWVAPWAIVDTSGHFFIQSIQDLNGVGATYRGSNGYAKVNFTGCKPKERLAFAVGKANDGYSTTGTINVQGA